MGSLLQVALFRKFFKANYSEKQVESNISHPEHLFCVSGYSSGAKTSLSQLSRLTG